MKFEFYLGQVQNIEGCLACSRFSLVSSRFIFVFALSTFDTAVSRKVVGRNAQATIPKGNMGYDQYTVRND